MLLMTVLLMAVVCCNFARGRHSADERCAPRIHLFTDSRSTHTSRLGGRSASLAAWCLQESRGYATSPTQSSSGVRPRNAFRSILRLTLHIFYGTKHIDGQFTLTTPTRLNSAQLLTQASKQRVVCAQHRDVTMLMTSQCIVAHSHYSWVELS